jgi:hypothetical protein
MSPWFQGQSDRQSTGRTAPRGEYSNIEVAHFATFSHLGTEDTAKTNAANGLSKCSEFLSLLNMLGICQSLDGTVTVTNLCKSGILQAKFRNQRQCGVAPLPSSGFPACQERQTLLAKGYRLRESPPRFAPK